MAACKALSRKTKLSSPTMNNFSPSTDNRIKKNKRKKGCPFDLPHLGAPLITYREVYKSFDGNEVLKGINLEVSCGETLVILGRSGSGKSVLTSMLVGLVEPDTGSISITDQELAELTNEQQWDRIRLQIGYLFQGSALYDSMTVGENIAFPLIHHKDLAPEELAEVVRRKLAMVGLQDIESLDPSALSGGMKRRVALARTLVLEPKIIIYDEPTTGLDPISSDTIAQLITQLHDSLDVTSIVVTHDMRMARHVADRLAMLYEGKIVFQGTLQELEACNHPMVRNFVSDTVLVKTGVK